MPDPKGPVEGAPAGAPCAPASGATGASRLPEKGSPPDVDSSPEDSAGPEDLSFGQIVIQKRLATWDQVKECLRIQAKLRSLGVTPKPLGQILVEKGYLESRDIEGILNAQKKGESQRTIQGYEIIAQIGKGAMGTVYKARQVSLDRVVALKILAAHHASDQKFIQRFVSEARTVARLNHENIIAGIDVGESGGYFFFAMEFVDGKTVADVIDASGPFDEKRAIRIVMQIARALAHAAKHGLVHRDIKPQNIMLTKNDTAKLCDLGLAKPVDQVGSEQKGYSVGTPHYISPEQARGLQDVDTRSDIYSLGATLYHMLTGETPFIGQSPMVLMTKHLTEDPVPVHERNPDVSLAVSTVVRKMMSRDREQRYQNPVEVIEDLERALQGGVPIAAGAQASAPPARKVVVGVRKEIREPKSDRLSDSTEQFVDRDAESKKLRRPPRAAAGGPRDRTSLVVAFSVTLVLVVGVVAVVTASAPWNRGPGGGPTTNESTDLQRNQEAQRRYEGILQWERANAGRTAEVVSQLDELCRTYPGTPAAYLAERHLRELRGESVPPLTNRP